MKNLNIHKLFKYIFSILILQIFLSTNLFAEDKKYTVNFNDTESDYTVLKYIHDNQLLGYENYNVNYLSNGEKLSDQAATINLKSSLVTEKTVEYSLFNLSAINSLNQKILINWQIDKNYLNDNARHESVNDFIDVIIKSDEQDINEIVQNNIFLNDNTKSRTTLYGENKNGTYIKGYSYEVVQDPTSPPKFWRTLAEVTIFTGLGTVKYWREKADNKEDWEYDTSWDGIKEKFTDKWHYDTNSFRTNTIYHMYAGAIYYQSARSNGYDHVESFIWTFMGSLLWEYVAEYREWVSINDMIFTTAGGVFLGEGLRQSSIFFEKRLPDNFLSDIFVFMLDPMRIINKQLNRNQSSSYRVNIIFTNPALMAFDKYKN